MDLPKPVFGNTYVQETNTEIRKTISGETKVVHDSDWPNIKKFKVTFKALDANLRDTLLDFLLGSAGQEQTILDHENITWTGIFIGDPELTDEGTVRRSGDTIDKDCKYSISMEFMGAIVG